MALSVLLIVFAGFFVPNTGNVNAQTEQAPESVLEVIDYKTDEGTFKEVRNLQEYRQLLSEQGLSDYEVSLRMLKVSGYTQEQIDRMPEEAILQNLDVKESKIQTSKVEQEEPIMTRAANVDMVEGLNLAVTYRTIELSKYASGRDPQDFLLISIFFDWAGGLRGMPPGRSNDFIGIYNEHDGSTPGITFGINAKPPIPSFTQYESASITCTESFLSKKEINLENGILSNYAEDDIRRVLSFEIPADDRTSTRLYYDLKGYYQLLGEINSSIKDTQKIKVVYGHSYKTIDISYSLGFSVSVSKSISFGVSHGIGFNPEDHIDSSKYVSFNYIYFKNDLDGVYIIQNVSTEKPLEVLGRTSSLAMQSITSFDKDNAQHRKNSYWQFKVYATTTSNGVEYVIKSVAINRYLYSFIKDNRGVSTNLTLGRTFRIVGNQVGEKEPYFKIFAPENNYTRVISAEEKFPQLYTTLLTAESNLANWFFIPVEAEDIGKIQNPDYDPQSNGVYKLKNVGTGKYIEIPDYNPNIDVFAKPATASAQKTCQEFRFQIVNGLTELCPNHLPYHRLDVQGETSGSGIPIQQYFDNNSDAQKFIMQPEKLVNGKMQFRIYTLASSLNAVLQCNTSNITQEAYSAGNSNQLWELVYQYTADIHLEKPSYYFAFRNVKSGHFLDVYNNETKNGTKILQYNFNGGNNQQWKIEHIGNGLLVIRSKLNTNCVLDIDRSKNNNGTKVQLWNYEGNKNQKFKIVQRYRGQYIIYANTSNFTKGLSVKDGSMNSGEIVHQWEYTGIRERWTISWMSISDYFYERDILKKLSIDPGNTKSIYFTPPVTGNYTIETVGTKDAMVWLYDNLDNVLIVSEQNEGLGNNEKITWYLTANKRYRIEVGYAQRPDTTSVVGVMIY